jgi:hypothetical protein
LELLLALELEPFDPVLFVDAPPPYVLPLLFDELLVEPEVPVPAPVLPPPVLAPE